MTTYIPTYHAECLRGPDHEQGEYWIVANGYLETAPDWEVAACYNGASAQRIAEALNQQELVAEVLRLTKRLSIFEQATRAMLKDIDPYGSWDGYGSCSCCGEGSRSPHAPTCPIFILQGLISSDN